MLLTSSVTTSHKEMVDLFDVGELRTFVHLYVLLVSKVIQENIYLWKANQQYIVSNQIFC